MRILVNARFLLPNKLEGIGLYTFEIVTRLADSHPEHDFILCVDRKSSTHFEFPKNVTFEVIRPMARHPFLFIWWFEVGIPRVYKRVRADLFFSPDGFLSLSRKVERTLLVIHDLAYLHYPDQISPIMLWYYQKYSPKFVAKADQILTVSNATAEDLATHFPKTVDKTTVIYNGHRNPKSMEEESMEEKVVLNTPYFISIGSLHPRKNLVGLIRAYDKLRQHSDAKIKLVVVGRKAWKTGPLQKVYNNSQYRDDILFTGYLPDCTMFEYLRKSIALVYVSFFEGFGLPIVDAMAAGVPVITSNRSSMKEIAGDAALLVDPENTLQIAQTMIKMFDDPVLREELISLGKKRVDMFSWDKASKDIWQIICVMQTKVS